MAVPHGTTESLALVYPGVCMAVREAGIPVDSVDCDGDAITIRSRMSVKRIFRSEIEPLLVKGDFDGVKRIVDAAVNWMR